MKRLADVLAPPSTSGNNGGGKTKRGRGGGLAPEDRTPVRSNKFAQSQLLNPSKYYNCPVHDIISMDVFCQTIVDTPEFQRLMHLKQLGVCSYVFRGAVHTRLEHSLGVAHLSERLATTLRDNQPQLGITSVEILCVKVAGLCHDLGHGPFSHVYDGEFIPVARPADKGFPKWKHEEGSIEMLRYLLKKNNIDPASYGVGEKDMLFIEEMIRGEETSGDKGATRKGRGADKFFLYDIVNNIRSGLDVDKLDYFQRDMLATNVKCASVASFERFIAEARVIPAVPIDPVSVLSCIQGGLKAPPFELMTCYPEKMADAAMDFFSCRFRMHKTVYTHKSVKQIEFMINDAMLAADPYIRIRGDIITAHPDGLYKMSECVESPSALARLNDNILEVIRHDPRPELATAQALLDRLDKRQLYKCLGQSPFERNDAIHRLKKSDIKAAICRITRELADGTYEPPEEQSFATPFDEDEDGYSASQSQNSLSMSQQQQQVSKGVFVEVMEEEIIVELMHVHFGLKDRNPVSRMRFYNKRALKSTGAGEQPPMGMQVPDDSCDVPRNFEKFNVRLFCKTQDRRKNFSARRAFECWCAETKSPMPFPSSQEEGAGLHVSGSGEN